MTSFTTFLFVFGIVMLISSVFTYKQVKVTTGIYRKLKDQGTLLIGEKRLLIFFIREIVAFAVGKDGKIKESVKVSKLLPFQRVKEESLPYKGEKFKYFDPARGGVNTSTVNVVNGMKRKYAKEKFNA